MQQHTKPTSVQFERHGDKYEELSHDAFGMVGISVVTGGDNVLFGSDLNHGQQVVFRVKRAIHQRHLNNDWFHGRCELLEFAMSHNQFAELITNQNHGDGVPCTLRYAPAVGANIMRMPAIDRIESKAEIMRNEIKASAKEQLTKVSASLAKVEELINSGSMSKKELKAALFSMKCHLENTPSNMEYVVKQSEEALEKAVTSAKIDIEAYISTAINKLGVQAANNLGLTDSTGVGFLESSK